MKLFRPNEHYLWDPDLVYQSDEINYFCLLVEQNPRHLFLSSLFVSPSSSHTCVRLKGWCTSAGDGVARGLMAGGGCSWARAAGLRRRQILGAATLRPRCDELQAHMCVRLRAGVHTGGVHVWFFLQNICSKRRNFIRNSKCRFCLPVEQNLDLVCSLDKIWISVELFKYHPLSLTKFCYFCLVVRRNCDFVCPFDET
jgi:hypothetical protein